MNEPRKDWDTYFMELAQLVATRSTCDRKHVGAVVVLQKRVVATGYNGSVPGQPHCDDAGHDMDEGHCVRTIHAEINAIAQAARFGTPLAEASLYVNTYPCWACMKVILASGIRVVIYNDTYRVNERVQKAADLANVILRQFPIPV